MQKLIELTRKKKKTAAGIMSGTSVDSIDIVLLEITGSGTQTEIKQLGFLEYPFPDGLKEIILRNSVKETSNVEEICTLNALIPRIYASGLKGLCEELNIRMTEVDFIGTHGQTIHHLPHKNEYFGYNFGSTLQTGDPSVLAKLTGVMTIGDFRTGDMAFGGEGAPLVPYFDYITLRSEEKNRIALNIGGISNFTVIKKNASVEDIIAFDTGPGNMMIDIVMKKLFNRNFDLNGEAASSGSVNGDLFGAMKEKDTFIEQKPPKSTGREFYGEVFLKNLSDKFIGLPAEDWAATVSFYTAYCIYRNYEKFIRPAVKADQLIVSGGGAKNNFVMKKLAELFGSGTEILRSDDLGISSDAKEAICFAVLANETINNNASNIPRVTGASRATILGKICLP